ncbi:TPA: hypothetical protein ACX6Q5_001087 [Photobacterium damselae]
MTNYPLLPMPTNCEEITKSYALLGRALAYATEFESNCRKLAHLSDVIKSESDYSFQVYLLLNSGTLHKKIRSISFQYELPKHAEETIHSARKARNNIAHSVAIGHKDLLISSDGRSYFRATILGIMDSLIEGNQMVEDMIRILSVGDKLSYGSDRVEYFFSVCDWLEG